MSLNKYLEYMTPQERKSAFGVGQTNLEPKTTKVGNINPIKSKPKLSEEDVESILGEYYNDSISTEENIETMMNSARMFHTTPDFEDEQDAMRLILMNDKFHWAYSDDMTHQFILFNMALSGIKYPYKYNNDNLMGSKVWWKSAEHMNSFLCLHFDPIVNDDLGEYVIAPSESYNEELINSIPTHYKSFLDKHGVRLITDVTEWKSYHKNR